MRRLRPALLALAIGLAALPSPAAAAAPNQLLDPKASPGSGSTATAFAFSVRYVSDRGWPALSVSASVAGKTVALKRAAGTPVNGTWSASASLPAGTWPVTFSADAEQGPDPSVVGPTVTVTVAATPKPQPAATPKPQPAATPQPPPPSTPQPAAPAPAPAQATPVPVPSTGSTPAEAATPRPVAPTASPAATPSTTMSSPTASPPSASAASPRPAATADAGGTTSGGRNGEADAAVLGIVALAGLILAGGGLVLVWSRLRSGSGAATGSATAAVRVDATPRAPSRRPRFDPISPEDPILAAMGVGNERRKES